MNLRRIQLAVIGLSLAGAMSASASVTLNYLGYGPEYQTVNIQVTGAANETVNGVVAGFYNFNINGGPTIKSFCIDIADNTAGSSIANIVNLDLAPDAWAGPMGATAASTIKKLWNSYYAGALGNANSGTLGNWGEAAALQVAIWEAIDNAMATYTLVVSGNAAVTARATAMLAAPGTVEADLMAVTGPAQDFIVPVPEPTTMIAGALLLLPFGASAVRILRRKQA
jgi:hypothetical protein